MLGIRRRRSLRRELADHLAALTAADARLQAAWALHAEMAAWPSPLACWLALQRPVPVPIPPKALAYRVNAPTSFRLNLESRQLPLLEEDERRHRNAREVQAEALRRAHSYRWGPRRAS